MRGEGKKEHPSDKVFSEWKLGSLKIRTMKMKEMWYHFRGQFVIFER